MARTYSDQQATRDYIRDLIVDMRTGPGADWTAEQWESYSAKCRAQIRDLFARRHTTTTNRYGMPV